MKLAILLLMMILAVFMFGEDIRVGGSNVAKYKYLTAADTLDTFLSNYFENTLDLHIGYKDFNFGMKFKAGFPEYDSENPFEELDSDEIGWEWKERFAEFSRDSYFIRAGHYAATFGSGMLFRAYVDEELDKNHQLEGLFAEFVTDKIQAQSFYGIKDANDNDEKSDVASGVDFLYNLTDNFSVAVTTVSLRNWKALGYDQQDVIGGRTQYSMDFFDFGVEYGHIKSYKAANIKLGDAFYANANAYLNNIVLSGAYKQYYNFGYASKLNDMPTLHQSGEPLSEDGFTGADEIGYMGEVAWTITDDLDIQVHYSESWDRDKTIGLADSYTKLFHQIRDIGISYEYEHLEHRDDVNKKWQKDVKPTIGMDFMIDKIPVTLKFANKYVSITDDKKPFYHQPKIQADFKIGRFSISCEGEYEFQNSNDLMKQTPWLNAEVKVELYSHTELVLFGGKQSGGKICRNGVCFYESEFEGAKISLNTHF